MSKSKINLDNLAIFRPATKPTRVELVQAVRDAETDVTFASHGDGVDEYVLDMLSDARAALAAFDAGDSGAMVHEITA